MNSYMDKGTNLKETYDLGNVLYIPADVSPI